MARSGTFKSLGKPVQRYRCRQCGQTASDLQSRPLATLRVPLPKAVQALSLFCEGMGVRATERLTGLSRKTVLAILRVAGTKCARLLDQRIRGMNCKRVAVDELYSFVECKQQNTTADDELRGDQYVFLAIDRDTKLILSHLVGKRDSINARLIMADVRERLAGRVQLSTDAFTAYTGHLGAVFQTFRHQVDYGTELKHFGQEERGPRRFNPVKCLWVKRTAQIGRPDVADITTAHIERMNLTCRLFNRRLTRLTLGYSKKLSYHRHAIALMVAHYNFCRKHSTHGQTPAMAAGLAGRPWTLEELLARAGANE